MRYWNTQHAESNFVLQIRIKVNYSKQDLDQFNPIIKCIMIMICFFIGSAKIFCAVVLITLLVASCEEQAVSPKQPGMSISATENSNAFISKLKTDGKNINP